MRTVRTVSALVCLVVLAACSAARVEVADPEPSTARSQTQSTQSATEPVTADRRPDAATTGVPEGTDLVESEGVTVTEPGTVLEGIHFRGAVVIEADDVTIRNSLVETGTSKYPIHIRGGTTGILIEDVEVDNMGGTGIGILYSGEGATLRRLDIHSAEDGIRIQGSNLTLEASYIHDMHRQPDGHHDTVQIRSGNNVTLHGNTLLAYRADQDDPMNAAIQIGSLLGDEPITNLMVIGNYLNGGNLTINGGGRGEVASATYEDNRFGRDFRYNVAGNLENSSFGETNVWDDTGLAVR